MFNKTVLSENFFIKGFISKDLKIDSLYLKNNIIKNYAYQEYRTKNKNSYKKDYLNLSWIHQYVEDFFKLRQSQPIEIHSISGILILPNDYITPHNHINYYDLADSPEISFLYVVDCGKKGVEVEFTHESIFHQQKKSLSYINKNEYLVFNSNLNHSITKNKNDSPTLLISMTFRFPRG